MYSARTNMQFLILLLLGLSASVLVQGSRRVIRVRKTGEFGRRISPISQVYEVPRRFSGLDPFLQTSESRNMARENNFGISKPSQKLQLPSYGLSEPDSIAAETGESLQGYAYPDPQQDQQEAEDEQGLGGYDYDPVKIQHPAVAEYPEVDPLEQQQVDDPPVPVQPEVEAEQPYFPPNPLGAEKETQIDASEIQAPAPAPRPVHDSPVAEVSSHCNENDQDCWPHGYEGVIPGVAGTDYPVLSEIVDTPFDCDNVQYSGYYADTDDQARCQIFHVCLKRNAYRSTRKWSFLCPNGTVFSQGDFVCVWWNNAPECNDGVVGELALRNAELGWDNLTETETRSVGGNFDVRTAMNSLANQNLHGSGSNTHNARYQAVTTTKRPTPTQPSRNAIPYRVPVKINSRTQLKEIAGNGINNPSPDQEYSGEESETFETSLSHQSEARHKSKTSSALRKSESEAYEQKSVPDSVPPPPPSPFVVNRAPVSVENDNQDLQVVQQGKFVDEETVPEVVMMATHQKNPDGSGGYADVPVMLKNNNAGYRYSNPSAAPGQLYLPPNNEYLPPSTTLETPTTTTFLPVTEESLAQGGYEYSTTEQSSSSAPSYAEIRETTAEPEGYTYPSAPTTTQGLSSTPTTTEVAYQEEVSSQGPVYEEINEAEGGYVYETSTAGQTDTPTTNPSISSTVSDTYLPPITEGGYQQSPRTVAGIKTTAAVLSLPKVDDKQSSLAVTTNPEPEDYTDAMDLSTIAGSNSIGESEGGYSIPTPPSSSSSDSTSGDNLDNHQSKVNKILEEIQNGGAEVRDENGNKLGYEELQKLILSTPNGLLSLQKAEDDPTTTDSSPSSSTEVPSSTSEEEVEAVTVAEDKPQEPKYHVVETIDDPPAQRYLPQAQVPQQQQDYFSNNLALALGGGGGGNFGSSNANSRQPSFQISTPSKEYESHVLQRNTGDQSTNPFSTFASFQTERKPQVNYQTPTPQNNFVQNFGSVQNKSPQVYYQQEPQISQNTRTQQPQQQFQVQQSRAPEPEVNFLQTPSSPRQEQYFQTQQPQAHTTTQQLNVNREASYFQANNNNNNNNPSTNSNSNANLYYQTQSQQEQQQPQQQQQFFQQQRQQRPNEYLPPSLSSSQTQNSFSSAVPTQFRNVATSSQRDLTNDIQLQQSYTIPIPIPQASTNENRQQLAPSSSSNPLDIKIVPALLVNQHTRVEHPNGDLHKEATQQLSSSNNFRDFNSNPSYIPYTSHSENVAVTVRAPRLNPFTLEDALPKRDKFTAEESRTAEQVLKYNPSSRQPSNLRHFAGSGGRGHLELSDEQNSLSNFYPGRDNSLGVKSTYN